MTLGLLGAVGRTSSEGIPAPNKASDQQQVCELLDASRPTPLQRLVDVLPPIEEGVASRELCEAIEYFQESHSGLIADGRVDVDKNTWKRLLELSDTYLSPGQPAPIILSVASAKMYELPQLGSAIPSLTYSLDIPFEPIYGPGVIIELTINGSIKVDWHNAMPWALSASSKTLQMQTIVDNGQTKQETGLTMKELSSDVHVESKAAIGKLFAAIKLSLGSSGSPVLSGSIGDNTSLLSVSWDHGEKAVIYRGEKQILQSEQTSFGAPITLTGKLRLELKVKSSQSGEEYEASIPAHLAAALVVGYVVLAPVVAIEGVGAFVVGAGEAIVECVVKWIPATLAAVSW